MANTNILLNMVDGRITRLLIRRELLYVLDVCCMDNRERGIIHGFDGV